MQHVESGEWFCELTQGKRVVKPPPHEEASAGAAAAVAAGEADDEVATPAPSSTREETVAPSSGDTYTSVVAAAVATADCFVSSGHGSTRSWELGFRYPNGFFISGAGLDDLAWSRAKQLAASCKELNLPKPPAQPPEVHCAAGELRLQLDRDGSAFDAFPPTAANTEKVWVACGNCLVGCIDEYPERSFLLAMQRHAKVRATVAYTVPTWYGYAGWGVLDYFIEQPGRYTLATATWANRIALEVALQRAAAGALGEGWSPPPAAPGQQRLPLPNAEEKEEGEHDGDGAGEATPQAIDAETRHRLTGLWHDSAVLAYFGDPAAAFRTVDATASRAVAPPTFQQALSVEAVTPSTAGDSSATSASNTSGSSHLRVTFSASGDFATVDDNGSERGGRPLVAFLADADNEGRPLPVEEGSPRVIVDATWEGLCAADVVVTPWAVCVPRPPAGRRHDVRVVIEFPSVSAP